MGRDKGEGEKGQEGREKGTKGRARSVMEE